MRSPNFCRNASVATAPVQIPQASRRSQISIAPAAPPLRNVALRAPYFHSGQVWSLKQAVGIMGADQLGIKLTDQDEDAIVAFLQTLTGEQPKIELPILPPRTDATPLPKQ